MDLDDVGVLKALENLNLLLDRLDGFLVSLEELLSQELEGVALLGVFDRPHEVHFGSVAFTKGAEDFVFFVEDWVVLLFGFLGSVLHFCCDLYVVVKLTERDHFVSEKAFLSFAHVCF